MGKQLSMYYFISLIIKNKENRKDDRTEKYYVVNARRFFVGLKNDSTRVPRVTDERTRLTSDDYL